MPCLSCRRSVYSIINVALANNNVYVRKQAGSQIFVVKYTSCPANILWRTSKIRTNLYRISIMGLFKEYFPDFNCQFMRILI
jgi:hypothetical protein